MPWPLRQSLRSLLGALDEDQPVPQGFKPYVPPNTPAAPEPLPPEVAADLATDRALYGYLDERELPVPPELPTWNRRSNPEIARRAMVRPPGSY